MEAAENKVADAVPTDDLLYYTDEELMVEEEVEDCEPSLDYPYCHSLWMSIYKTYTMMLGEIDDTIFYWSNLALVLFCIFFFMEVVILLNILIAIITDLYGVITNERAAIVFWSNRLAFITDMDMITNGPWKKSVMKFFRMKDDEEDEDEEEAALMKKEDTVDISWERICWKKLIECFDPEMGSNGMGMILIAPLRLFISMFLVRMCVLILLLYTISNSPFYYHFFFKIPFWLLLGILSAGWLWPPQVREGLFVQAVSVPDNSGEAKEMEKRIEEVTILKKDLKTVQKQLVEEFIDDRKDMSLLKDQVKGIKSELKDEMKNIKMVMTSLFEVQQQTMIS